VIDILDFKLIVRQRTCGESLSAACKVFRISCFRIVIPRHFKSRLCDLYLSVSEPISFVVVSRTEETTEGEF